MPPFSETEDILEDDDGVVDKQPEPERQTAQGQKIDGYLEQVDQVKSDQNREGYGGEDKKRRFITAEHQEN